MLSNEQPGELGDRALVSVLSNEQPGEFGGCVLSSNILLSLHMRCKASDAITRHVVYQPTAE